ncbi:NAD(+) synthase [Clostridia bacterium]|nr:NAD(+) synthase [Clostridia bacterium]
MFNDHVRVAAATPKIRVADCRRNAEEILKVIERAGAEEVGVLVLPELCVTGYTCGDLFRQETLLRGASDALKLIAERSANFGGVVAVGLPLAVGDRLYSAAAIVAGGKVLGYVPKTHIPNYCEFYELRHFAPAPSGISEVDGVPFGTDLIFECGGLRLSAEICEDLWAPLQPSVSHALAGANLIVNLSASDETIGKADYRRALVSGQSGRLLCGYAYAGAGYGESTTDMVFAAHNLICENGVVLSEARPFGDGWSVTEIDLAALSHDRRRMNTFRNAAREHVTVPFELKSRVERLTRFIDPHPFVPNGGREREARCEEILSMQSMGLAKRLEHTASRSAVVGVSGGLDSCLALLAAERAFKALNKPPSELIAVTMPCFGTSERTRGNALKLCAALGVTCREIDITDTVRAHFRDIGHDERDADIVYENAQARLRTLVLMDIANQSGGLVVGTGDLSELALGWATYNGDHMSMYGVNAGVPKTLVRHIVRYAADNAPPELSAVLLDILDTPVSPELLPSEQNTEDIVGPYELHDFFLYHMARWGRSPAKVFALAETAFPGYTAEILLKWLKNFYSRFFAQQFKRSCLPDGPKIGSVTLSPRGDWRMPGDAQAALWLEELEVLDSSLRSE